MSGVRRWWFLLVVLVCIGSAVAQTLPQNTYQDLRWRMIGPFRGGRTRAAVGVSRKADMHLRVRLICRRIRIADRLCVEQRSAAPAARMN